VLTTTEHSQYIIALKSQLEEVDQQLKAERSQAFIASLLNAHERRQLESVADSIEQGGRNVFVMLAHAFRIICDFSTLNTAHGNLAYYIGTGADTRFPDAPDALTIFYELEAIGEEIVAASRSIEQVFMAGNFDDSTFSWVVVPDSIRAYHMKSGRLAELCTQMRERLDIIAREPTSA
jgi:hypothetical protein